MNAISKHIKEICNIKINLLIFIILVGQFFIVQTIYAAVKKYHYISLNQTPRYASSPYYPFANPHAPKGGELSFPAMGTFDNFNSMNGKGTAAQGVQYLYDSLMKSSPDEAGIAYPLLAESVSYDPLHPRYAIFHLNPKAKFNDGTPVTAQDVEYTFKKILTEGAFGLQIYFADIKNVTALNRYDVRFEFKNENNKEMPLIVSTISIFSKRDLEKKDFSKVTLIPPLGSGPYSLAHIHAGRMIIYQRNQNYWAKDLPINRGAYNFDRIKYIYYRDENIAFEGFKVGQYTMQGFLIDYSAQNENMARRWMTEYHFNAVKDGKIKRLIYHHQNPIPTKSIILNTRRKPLNNIYFRMAMTYAYDFEWQNKALFYGQYKRLQSFFDNSELQAKGLPSKEEYLILKEYFPQMTNLEKYGVLIDWKYPVSNANGFNRDNLITAYRILKQQGYQYNQQGQLLDKNHYPIQLELLIHQPNMIRVIMPFIRNLQRLGITVTIRQVDISQYYERIRHYDYDMIVDTMPQRLNPGNEQARFWTTQAANQDGNYNYAGIRQPVIDDIVDKLIHSQNRQQQILYTKVLDRLLRAGYYHILMEGKENEWYAYWDMYEYPKSFPRLKLAIEYWWINKNKQQQIHQYLKKNYN